MDRWNELYARMEAARNRVAAGGKWQGAAVLRAQRIADRWWGWWDRTHGDDGDGYRRANGLFGA